MADHFVLPPDGSKPFTDYSKWRLDANDGGRHVWKYVDSEQQATYDEPQSALEKYWLGLPTGCAESSVAEDALSAARKAFHFYKNLQAQDGHWPGEYGGPMFLIPGLVIGSYVSEMDFREEERRELIRYLFNRAHKEDGGWGLHVEGPSTVFGTALNYVALRLLGVPAEHPVTSKARKTLHRLGGATGAPAWGKFWLSILNVYDWDGNNPVPPELWLLPEWLPIHPHRWWIHTRNVYIPMSYLYAHRFQAPENALILALRKELYIDDYDQIDWPAQRNNVAAVDLYAPHTTLLNVLFGVLSTYEACSMPPLRRVSLKKVYRLIVQEDENTAYQTLGPVSKMMNLVCRYHAEGTESFAWKEHYKKRWDFMWMGADGMMMCGTNGSQLWDIAFMSQALVESGLAEEKAFQDNAIRCLHWLDQCQIQDNPKHFKVAYRHPTKGAWPFSTKEQGYTVSDCTGEGLKAVLYLQEHLSYTPKLVSQRRLYDAVDIILGMQNIDGGFASYELIRGPKFLELINPAEVFGNIMIEYNYPECTTSAVTALSIFKKHYPNYRRHDIERVTRKAVEYIKAAQNPNGAWYGSWGICFTYASQFALESLSLVGETYATSDHVRRACDFLVSKQRSDGGWGESWRSCEEEVWVEHEQTQVVQTAWATMALMYAQYPHRGPIERAMKMVMDRQLPDGSWAQEAIEGMFNKTCAIAYPNFKFSFTIWMLGKGHSYLQHLT
ncbi:terpene synthase [Sistotremastrum niveocremeum HHB9708]|uniref:Terpene cyclase/mutase family member n=1 Tax=Sistotremastrum niveocremeum HHB9708 TaxID=1314777 RepID=A0A164VQW1_9AGAM|nr:terpene synthase [Sistotremastrum niveocremeum HHB9708]